MSSPQNLGPTMPTDVLEVRAAEQRRRLHNSVAELRSTVREQLDAKRVAREHLLPAAALAAGIGLIFGYGMGGMFTR
jgi:hypothetical protein